MKRAVIENGLVTNIIEADAKFKPAGMTLVAVRSTTQIGGGWDGRKFTPAPPEPAPKESAERQAMRELAAEIGPGAVAKINARFGAVTALEAPQ